MRTKVALRILVQCYGLDHSSCHIAGRAVSFFRSPLRSNGLAVLKENKLLLCRYPTSLLDR